jgi:hypothetical protein
MNRTTLLASGAALTLVAGSTFAAVGVASASSSTHTLVLHGTTLSTHEIGKSHEVEANTLRKGGKIVGYSTDSCDFGSTQDKCAVTYALEGGDLLGHVTFPISNGSDPAAHGKITGGLGSFTGAKGTIKVIQSGPSAGTITLKYTG